MNRQTALNILGLNDGVSEEEIKKMYKKLALKYHPDKNNGKDEKFKELKIAYDTLTNNESSSNPFEDIMNNSGLFNHFFGGINIQQQHQNNPKKCNNTIMNIKIKLKEIHQECIKKFKIKLNKICMKCSTICNKCNGTGQITEKRQFGPMFQIITNACVICQNIGTIQSKCEECNFKGHVEMEQLIELKIPICSKKGETISFVGFGEQPKNQKDTPGDLIFVLDIEDKDEYFQRRNNNLIYQTSITLKESLLGKNIIIPYYDSNITLNIKTLGIINPNKEYTLFNYGLGKLGDLILIFKIIYPEICLDDNEISLLNNTFNLISKLN